jgi:N-acetyl-alpha-D-muramate 1-phosphate uridylyltransferase
MILSDIWRQNHFMKAMIFAAGLGTRFKPWTDQHPKALALINGKSLLERNIRYLQVAGIREVIVNVHHFASQVIDIIKNQQGWGSQITISDESGALLETGGGLQKASWFFDAAFLVMNVDILTDLDLRAMISEHEQQRPLATLAVSLRPSSRYFLFDDEQRLSGWRNTRTQEEKIQRNEHPLTEKAFSGIHIIEPAIFSSMRQKGKFSIVDTYLDLCASAVIKGFDHSHSRLIDVGKPEAVGIAEKMFP